MQEFIYLNKNNIKLFYEIFSHLKNENAVIKSSIDYNKFNEYLIQFNIRDDTSFILKDNSKTAGLFLSAVRNKIAYIPIMGVLKEQRLKGYGRILLQKGLNLFDEYNCKKVMLEVSQENKNAIKLYKEEGFNICNEILNLDLYYKKINNFIDDEYKIKISDELYYHILYKSFNKNPVPWQKKISSIINKIKNKNTEVILLLRDDIIKGYAVVSRDDNHLFLEDIRLNEDIDKIKVYLSKFIKKENVIIANNFYVDDPIVKELVKIGFYPYLTQFEMEKVLL